MIESNVALDIQFIDPPGDLDVGEKYRFRVVKRGAMAHNHNVEISQLDFVFRPNTWGKVEATDDPYTAVLRVVELIDNDDIYDLPDYSVAAMLKAQGATVLRPRRQSRMATRRIEVELLFLHGFAGNFERFDPLRAVQPIDPQRAFNLESDKQQIVVRDGRIFLQAESVEHLRTFVECKLPNGELVSCDLEQIIDSGAAWQQSEPYEFPIYEESRSRQPRFQQSLDTRPVRLENATVERLEADEETPAVVDEARLDLAIEFIDAPGDMIPGDEIRFKVELDGHALEIRKLHFEFQPVVWAALQETDDPKIGRLRVLDLPRPADIYERPNYWINVSLRAFGQNAIQPRRFVRLIPGEVFLELVFYRGHGENFELFNPLTAKRPLNTQEGIEVSHPRLRPNVREDWLFLHFDRLCDLRSTTNVTLPNGETMTLDLGTKIQNGSLFRVGSAATTTESKRPAPKPTPRPAPPPAMPVRNDEGDSVERGLREKLRQLKSFIISFHARKNRPTDDQATQIKDRISARVKQTKDALKQYEGSSQKEFLKAFEDCISLIPDYLRSPPTPASEPADAE